MIQGVPTDAWAFWAHAMYHEAGHAIASLALWNETADITARNCFKDNDEETPDKRASFKIKLPMFGHDHKSRLDCIIACAAGAKAEMQKFGFESGGFVGDEAKIRFYVAQCHDPAEKALLDAEIAIDYSRTGDLLSEHASAFEAIGHRALTAFWRKVGHRNYVEETVILTGDEIRETFEAHGPA